MNRQIVTLRITENEDQVSQCSQLSPAGRLLWMLDRGKEVKVYLPAYPVGTFSPNLICEGQICFAAADESQLTHDPTMLPTSIHLICRHFLDMD